MRTNIVIDKKLMLEAMQLSRVKTKKGVVELALENLVKSLKRRKMKDLFGKVKWEGDLREMRNV